MKVLDKKQFDKMNTFGMGKPNEAFAQYFVGESFFESADKSTGNDRFSCQCDL